MRRSSARIMESIVPCTVITEVLLDFAFNCKDSLFFHSLLDLQSKVYLFFGYRLGLCELFLLKIRNEILKIDHFCHYLGRFSAQLIDELNL